MNEMKNNYHKCVVLNDLQRQLVYTMKQDDQNCHMWCVWHKGNYLGCIYRFNHSLSIYTSESANDVSRIHDSFMEALAVFIDDALIAEENNDVTIIEPVTEKPETTIWKTLKGLFLPKNG